MSKKNWSAFIPKEKLGTKNDMEVIFEIPKSIILNDLQLKGEEVQND